MCCHSFIFCLLTDFDKLCWNLTVYCQVDCFSCLGCSYHHIFVDWPTSIPFPEWGFHQAGRYLGYIRIYFYIFFHVLLDDIVFICLFFFTRSFGHCSICILLLLPTACSHCRGYDAWPEISLHYNSSHEVMNFLAHFFVLFLYIILFLIYCF